MLKSNLVNENELKILEVMSMGMTMTQKILAAHAGLDKVEAGQLSLIHI